MNEMIKRAVEAMQDAWEGADDDPPPLEVLARAAIEGIREPTEEMIAAAKRGIAVCQRDGYSPGGMAGVVWLEMIDAALEA